MIQKIFFVFLICSLLVFSFVKYNTKHKPKISLKENSLILAFGDSLTHGYGVDEQFSYPMLLQEQLQTKVMKSGVNGELSREGLQRLPQMLKHNPDLVLLCHGGNDIINRHSLEELKSNIKQMILLIRESGAEVILIGVPGFGMFGVKTLDLYDELSEELNVLIENEALEYIQKRPSLKSDYVHPNTQGYKYIATKIYELLEKNRK